MTFQWKHFYKNSKKGRAEKENPFFCCRCAGKMIFREKGRQKFADFIKQTENSDKDMKIKNR